MRVGWGSGGGQVDEGTFWDDRGSANHIETAMNLAMKYL